MWPVPSVDWVFTIGWAFCRNKPNSFIKAINFSRLFSVTKSSTLLKRSLFFKAQYHTYLLTKSQDWIKSSQAILISASFSDVPDYEYFLLNWWSWYFSFVWVWVPVLRNVVWMKDASYDRNRDRWVFTYSALVWKGWGWSVFLHFHQHSACFAMNDNTHKNLVDCKNTD